MAGANKSRRLGILAGVAVAIVLLFGATLTMSCQAAPDEEWVGMHEGDLKGCPDKPNCVSTEAAGEDHWIEPFPMKETAEISIDALAAVIAEMPRSEIVEREDRYLHAVFRSRIFRFPDDVEFLVDEEAGDVQARAAARLGHSDFGVNRRRMEEIRAAYLAR